MDFIIYLIVGLLVGAVAGFFIGKGRGGGSGAPNVAGLETEVRLTRERAEAAERQLTELREKERLEALQEAKYAEKLAPIAKVIGDMQDKVGKLERERIDQFNAIKIQLETQQATDAQLRNTTAVLANAMTNNQTRGGWGEIRLEQIVQEAGLVKGVHYETQFETTNSDGTAIRPDMVINLADGKFVAVDSKAPMANFMKAQLERERGLDANKDLIKQYMKAHVNDVKAKIKDLGNKNYWSGLPSSPEFTVLFIPNEPTLALTLDEENLMEFAFQHRVALVSPVSFFTVIKTVAYTWRQSADEKAIHQIIDMGVSLYRELRLVGTKLSKMRGHLEATVEDFNSLLTNIDGKMLKPMKDLNAQTQSRLGNEAIPDLSPIDEPLKRLSSPELTQDSLPSADSDAGDEDSTK